MLRMVLAIALLVFGATQSLRGPFYALLFYLGFAYFRPETWVWSDALQGLNLSFIVGVTVLVSMFFSKERVKFSPPVVLIILFCLHALASTLMSPYPEWCFVWWKGFAKVSLISVLIVSLVNTPERFRLTLLVITFALGFEGAKQGWAFLLLRSTEANTNSLEILGDNNGVALGMLMLSAIIMGLFQTTKVKWQKALFGVLVIGTLFRSLTTYSRGGLLAFGAMCLIYWARSRYRVRTAVVVGSIAVSLLAVLPAHYWERMGTIQAAEDDRDFSTLGRLHFWKVARRMAADHPFFGVGTIGFQAAYNDYDTSDGAFGHDRAVHSTWFGLLADQGYIGLGMFIALLVIAFLACGRVRRASFGVSGREDLFAFSGALQTSLVTAVVGGTFLSYHYVEILWHFIALSFSLAAISARVAVPQAVTVAATPRVHPALQPAR